MFDCKNLLHPFQNDPGTSQRQRIIDQLLSGDVKIDGRSLADLLHYFANLSRGINYYDRELAVSDWQPFFKDSVPFLLAAISNYDDKAIAEKFECYQFLFLKDPSASGLQLIIHFIYYNTIYKIYNWYEQIREQDLPVRNTLEELIRNKLAARLKQFIQLVNAAAQEFGTKRIDFSRFMDTADNDAWDMTIRDIHSVNASFVTAATDRCGQMKALFEKLAAFFAPFLEAIRLLAAPARDNINASLLLTGSVLQKSHSPHLALVFAFIRLFQKMQDELNKKTKEHLKYFYTEVLRIKPREAEPDRANIVFEVQKILQDQYQKYKLEKGIALDGGRDNNNSDIVFTTDDEIIVNETQVAEVRTLFLNNELAVDRTFLEGLYIAPKADKEDGVEKDFKDDAPKNWFTMGSRVSKYTEPGRKTPKLHPSARLGFVLASPVLYLGGGKRTIDITLDCLLSQSACDDLQQLCNSVQGNDCPDYPKFYDATATILFNRVSQFLYDPVSNKVLSYIYISSQLLEDAAAAGISKSTIDTIRNDYLLTGMNSCTGDSRFRNFVVVPYNEWATHIQSAGIKTEIDKLPALFKERYPFNIYFSGEKEWIIPSSISNLQIIRGAGNQFNFLVSVVLEADKPPVTFYNSENLGEELGTELPLVKIELDDTLKLEFSLSDLPDPGCCLEEKGDAEAHYVSLYHFFRNASVQKNTKIDVTVCGLKNFVVQNDENVMDVNAIVHPFGTIPKIGSNFLIGSKEIFCKNWSEFNVKFNWRNRPADFSKYYHGYEDLLATPVINTAYFNNNNFNFTYSLLKEGRWFPLPAALPPPPRIKQLFTAEALSICTDTTLNQGYRFLRNDFNVTSYVRKDIQNFKDEIFTNSTRDAFLRLTLFDRDFQHSRYSFVLTRQMVALSRMPEIYVGPVYDGVNPVTNQTIPVLTFDEVFKAIEDAYKLSQSGNPRVKRILDQIRAAFSMPPPFNVSFNAGRAGDAVGSPLPGGANIPNNHVIQDTDMPPLFTDVDVDKIFQFLEDPILKKVRDKLGDVKKIRVVIPNEPYTPQLQGITLDYKANADIADIDLIHLYPFRNTYKPEEIELTPRLFPTFCDEGTLYIGLKDLQPGVNLNILFQLAEATADSETDPEKVRWHYLDNNVWKPLRTGFEVLEDGTLHLTSSGIVKFSLPENMTNINTIMPPGMHWIKASMAKNSRTASEMITIHTQAIRATFTLEDANDKSRLGKPLDTGSVARLLVADPAIKTVSQPYETFGGLLPELDGSYYLRVSERLRHKGRAIQKWDYERLVLEKFPQLFKAKCVNHSFHTNAHTHKNDIPYAPGYVLLALIPDLNKLKAGNSFEPKVPVSLLEKTEQYLKTIISPFVRLKAANPRYEKIHFCLKIQLVKGKDKNYYEEKLKSDLSEFLAPWAIGKYDKLSFGQCVYRSDVLRFLEQTGYVDFIKEIRMTHESEPLLLIDRPKVCPLSPRSILIAGNVDVIINDPLCENWCSKPVGVQPCNETVPVNDYCKPKIILNQ